MGSYRIVSFLVPCFLAALCFLLQFSLAVDTIIPGKSLRTNETLVSEGETFVLGFFNTSIPHKLYLGIWYYKIPVQTIVWVGNRETPLTDSSGSLQITNNGTLVILNGEGTSIWSVNVPKVATNPAAKLLDSGNLIIIEAQDSVDNNGNFLWQSFDYPTHTLLPGMKIGIDLKTGLNRFLTSWKTADDPARGDFSYRLDHRGSPQFYIYDNSTPIYRTGPWIGNKFSGTPELGLATVFNFSFIDNQDESYYIYFIVRKDIVSRLAMAESGTMIRYTWSNENQAWSPLWRNPRDDCDNYEFCPAFANCNSNNQLYCSCLQGFEPRSIDQWNLRNFSGGCHRRTKLACGNGDWFLVIQNIKFPDTSMAQVEEGLSLVDCGAKCLSNCNCSGYGKTNVNGRDGCLIWYGDLVDLREFSDINQQFYVRVAASEVNQTSGGKKKRNTSIMITAIVVPVFVAIMLDFSIYGYMPRRKAGYVRHKTRSTESILFDLDIVRTATGNFCVENQLGVGGFGPVYKGTLPDGQEIAVKRLSMNSGQGVEQFMNELRTLAKLQHRNLVRLLGCCLEGHEKLLMYEYVPNKSLDNFLFDPIKRSQLSWEIRCKIIEGIARGLLYLHQDSRLRIIHRDLKASNILLDMEMNPKISDFGLAKLFGGEQSHGNTRRIAGTYGYMAPEYVIHGQFSIKSDVFSFGVLLLEIITGQKNSGFNQSGQAQDLLSYTWIHWRGGRALEVVDQGLREAFPPASEVLRIIHIGLLCVQKDAVDRPIMSSVVLMLSNNSITLRAPSPPFFVASRAGLDALSRTSASTSTESDRMSRPMPVSNNEMSITELEPR